MTEHQAADEIRAGRCPEHGVELDEFQADRTVDGFQNAGRCPECGAGRWVVHDNGDSGFIADPPA